MNTSDLQILQLIEILKARGEIRSNSEFCETIGLLRQNLTRIKAGKAHFTPEHIERAVNKYKVNANWIFGVSDRIFNTSHAHAHTK